MISDQPIASAGDKLMNRMILALITAALGAAGFVVFAVFFR